MPAANVDPLIGAMIDGRWRVLRVIGAGLMGVVYEAERAQLGRKVALKVLHEQYSANDQFVRRFAREARVLSRLQHLHCVSILDVGSHGGRPYIVMELVAGHPLTAEIGAPTMNPQRAVQLMRQVLLALGHAHGHGVVHRDLKPDNIMVTELADVGSAVKVLDFGFAHFHDSRMSQSNSKLVPGTPSYMSPEQATGTKADHRTDLYSAGIILYELCVGHKLFVAGDAIQMLHLQVNELPVRPRLAAPDAGISEALDEAIMRAIQKDREQRVQSAEEFRAALDATPEGREALGREQPKSGRRLWVYGLAAVALALATTLALVMMRLR
jgi:serine/threonine-protein kinase